MERQGRSGRGVGEGRPGRGRGAPVPPPHERQGDSGRAGPWPRRMGLQPKIEDEAMAIPATIGGPRERLWWLGDLLEVEDGGEGLRFTGIGVDRGGGHGGDEGHRELLELGEEARRGTGRWLRRVRCLEGVGAATYSRVEAVRARVPPWTRVLRHGRVCSRPSSNGNKGEVDEGHGDERGSGTRDGRSHNPINALSALCARGRAASSSGEEAWRGGKRSRAT